MQVNNISLSVKDLEESIKFYTEILGFKLLERMTTGIGPACMLDAGNVKVTLFKTEKIPIGIFDFNMVVDDLPKALKEFEAKGAKILMKPQQVGIGQMAKIWDPSNISIMVSQLNADGKLTENKITHIPNKEK